MSFICKLKYTVGVLDFGSCQRRTPTIDIIAKIKEKINRYNESCKNNNIRKPARCIFCKNYNCLRWWSWYERKVITLFAEVTFSIKRVCCHVCKKTFCCLPDFLIKYYRYAKDVIAYALHQLKEYGYNEIANMLSQLSEDRCILISIQTLMKWNKLFHNKIILPVKI